MKAVLALCIVAAVFSAAQAQFVNGRILEPPVPNLCAQRTIHERRPDGLYNITYLFNILFGSNDINCNSHFISKLPKYM